jgi:gamma-tubulin complex component 3
MEGLERMRYLGMHRTVTEEVYEDHMDEEVDKENQVPVSSGGDILWQLHSRQQPSELDLLRELPYVLQGIRTDNFNWTEGPDGKFSVTMPTSVPYPLIGLLNQVLEPAVLYKNLSNRLSPIKNGGLVKQSLSSAVQQELQSYLTLIGVIENQVRQREGYEDVGKAQNSAITLRRCVVLLNEATLGLRLLYSLTTETEELVGGPVLSVLHKYTYNGDEFVAKFSRRLLEKLSKPFYEMLNQWVSSGNLVDPHGEFFVQIADHKSVWEGRFNLDLEMVPGFMTQKVAEEVFEIGKTLYFVRVACNDTEWVDWRRSTNPPIRDYKDVEKKISEGYGEVVEHLNKVLKEKFYLDLHLQALKDYLLLAKGDFVQVLVESAAPVLDKPANKLLRHHLTSTLETSIRSSNAQYDNPEVLKNLDARMLELGHGDIGWDVFTLDYRVERPLDVVLLNKGAMTDYLRVFNFLWRIRRVSFSLIGVWKKLATGERQFLKYSDQRYEWQQVRRVFQEMIHFICELQYYIDYEVVEMAWSNLQRQLLRDGGILTVDEIIKAHRTYLSQITHKGLLGGGSLIGELHQILKGILAFRDSIDGLYELAVRIQSHGDGGTENDLARFGTICTRIADLKTSFEKSVERLVHNLSKQEDSEMRFLSVRLDFNHFYSALRTSSDR